MTTPHSTNDATPNETTKPAPRRVPPVAPEELRILASIEEMNEKAGIHRPVKVDSDWLDSQLPPPASERLRKRREERRKRLAAPHCGAGWMLSDFELNELWESGDL